MHAGRVNGWGAAPVIEDRSGASRNSLLEAPSSAAAAIPGARALVCFIHLERTTLEVFRVELLDRFLK